MPPAATAIVPLSTMPFTVPIKVPVAVKLTPESTVIAPLTAPPALPISIDELLSATLSVPELATPLAMTTFPAARGLDRAGIAGIVVERQDALPLVVSSASSVPALLIWLPV